MAFCNRVLKIDVCHQSRCLLQGKHSNVLPSGGLFGEDWWGKNSKWRSQIVSCSNTFYFWLVVRRRWFFITVRLVTIRSGSGLREEWPNLFSRMAICRWCFLRVVLVTHNETLYWATTGFRPFSVRFFCPSVRVSEYPSIRKSERLFAAASRCKSREVVTVAVGDGCAHHRPGVEGVESGGAPGSRRLGWRSVGAWAGDVWGWGRSSESLRRSEPREREPGVGVPEAAPVRTAADELPSSRAGSMRAAVDHLALNALHLPNTNKFSQII